MAVEHAATLVVFLIDPSESCGYPLPDQQRLLAQWREELPNVPFLIVGHEVRPRSGRRGTGWVSAKTGEGVAELRESIGRERSRLRRAQAAPADSIPGVQRHLKPLRGRRLSRPRGSNRARWRGGRRDWRSRPWPQGAKREVLIEGATVLLVRLGPDVFAIEGICSHQGGLLADGTPWRMSR